MQQRIDFESHQKKGKDIGLTMRLGCCTWKEDSDAGREVLKANGMSTHIPIQLLALDFRPVRLFLSM
jgi:hypothetical protein